jgi:hypothetical protein
MTFGLVVPGVLGLLTRQVLVYKSIKRMPPSVQRPTDLPVSYDAGKQASRG